MTHILALLTVLFADTHQAQTAGSRPLLAQVADVKVVLNGVTQHGRLIVTRDGVVHLEHLDCEAQQRVQAVIRRTVDSSQSWDDRTDPVMCLWCRLGSEIVLAEVHTRVASVFITQHQALPNPAMASLKSRFSNQKVSHER